LKSKTKNSKLKTLKEICKKQKTLKKFSEDFSRRWSKATHTFGSVSDAIGDITLKKKTPFHWFIGLGISFLIAQSLLFTVVYLVVTGIGIWGNNQPVGWAFDIINFVWWIGIGHAGTLISAILLLMNQKWRTSINRFAEAMTLFAVACAGFSRFSIRGVRGLHTGCFHIRTRWVCGLNFAVL
jgi:hypothetical protein